MSLSPKRTAVYRLSACDLCRDPGERGSGGLTARGRHSNRTRPRKPPAPKRCYPYRRHCFRRLPRRGKRRESTDVAFDKERVALFVFFHSGSGKRCGSAEITLDGERVASLLF